MKKQLSHYIFVTKNKQIVCIYAEKAKEARKKFKERYA